MSQILAGPDSFRAYMKRVGKANDNKCINRDEFDYGFVPTRTSQGLFYGSEII